MRNINGPSTKLSGTPNEISSPARNFQKHTVPDTDDLNTIKII